jgi:hypothetical protein
MFLSFILAAHNLSDSDSKQILTRFNLNSFSVRFRLLHAVRTINGWIPVDHPSMPIWEQEKFTESMS